jgi:DNA processing protein
VSAELPLEAHLAALASLEGVGPATMRWLLSLGAPSEVWQRVLGRSLPLAPSQRRQGTDLRAAWAGQAADIDPAELWRRCERLGIGVVSLGGPGYPPVLRDDPEPPVVLFHRGDPDVLAAPLVGIVGTRRCTGYGTRHAAAIAAELTGAGVGIVSGLALGIDAAAHRGALSVPGAAPVAVVGAGLDAPCPRRNRDLAARVAERGVLLSEVPPGVPALPWRFPVRNRIIAALSRAVLVVESPGAGGSMHTVAEAERRQRTVLAVPGPIDSHASEGANRLIADGVLVCNGSADVLAAIGHQLPGAAPRGTAPAESRPLPTGDAAAVLGALGWRPCSIDALAAACGLGFAGVVAAVGHLEQAGWVVRSGSWVERVAVGQRVPITGHGDA